MSTGWTASGDTARVRSRDSDLRVRDAGLRIVGGLELGFGKSEYPPDGGCVDMLSWAVQRPEYNIGVSRWINAFQTLNKLNK